MFVFELSGCGFAPVAVTYAPDIAPFSNKNSLDIQATTECRFTPKRVCDMIRTHDFPNLVIPSLIEKKVLNTIYTLCFWYFPKVSFSLSRKKLKTFVKITLRIECQWSCWPKDLLKTLSCTEWNKTRMKILICAVYGKKC